MCCVSNKSVDNGKIVTRSESASTPIRVVISQLPKIINDLLIRRMEDADIEVVEVTDQIDLLLFESVKDEVDLLILGVQQAYPPQRIVSDLLRIAPKLRILALQFKDDVMTEYWLGLRSITTKAHDSHDPIQRIQQLHERDAMEWQDG